MKKVECPTCGPTAVKFVSLSVGDGKPAIWQIFGPRLPAEASERSADLAVNIAEDVIYIVKGEDVRHFRRLTTRAQRGKTRLKVAAGLSRAVS